MLRKISASNQDLANTSAWVDITFDNQQVIDGSYFTQASNDYELTITKAGIYQYQYKVAWDNTNSNRVVIKTGVRVNGNLVGDTEVYAYNRGSAYGDYSSNQATGLIELQAGDVIKLSGRQDHDDSGNTGLVRPLNGDCYFHIWGWPIESA